MRAAGPSQGVKVPLRGSDPRAAEERGGNMNGARSPLLRRAVGVIGFACGVALTGCASGPAVPDWRLNAQTASERATQADLQGKTRIATSEFDRMRREIARTGDAALMARAELLRCSIQVASLAFGPCARFEALRADATVAELAYADYLADPAYIAAREALMATASDERTCVMCAEAVWWRCHRRLIADDFVARGWTVLHLLAPGKTEPHVLNPDALMVDGVLRYPGPQPALL